MLTKTRELEVCHFFHIVLLLRTRKVTNPDPVDARLLDLYLSLKLANVFISQ